MLLKIIFFVVVICGGGYFLFDWAVKAWKKADVTQKVDDFKLDTQVYDKVKDVDMKEVKKQKKVIDKFMDE